MPARKTLFHSQTLIRLVLMWFVLSLGAAIASPIVKPRNEVLVCTSAGAVQMELQDDGSFRAQPTHEAHCPLCLVAGVPPSAQPLTGAEAVTAAPPVSARDDGPPAAHHFSSPPARAPPQA